MQLQRVGEQSALLRGANGEFLLLGPKNYSKYYGFLQLDDWQLRKSFEDIRLQGTIKRTIVTDGVITREYERGAKETFWTTEEGFIQRINGSATLQVTLDVRDVNHFPNHGRIYHIKQEGNIILIHYEEFLNENLQEKSSEYWLAISGLKTLTQLHTWEPRKYAYDAERNSQSEAWVYHLLDAKVKDQVITYTAGKTKKEVLARTKALQTKKRSIPRKAEKQTEYALAKNALTTLTYKQGREGILAGLPWFSQFWSRDELISLTGHFSLQNYSFIKQVLLAYTEALRDDGRLPNRLPHSDLASADSVYWLWHQWKELFEKKKDALSKEEWSTIFQSLTHSLDSLEQHYSKEGLIHNAAKETWMDTDWQGDTREGYCIEIQAGHLQALQFARRLADYLTLPDRFIHREAALKNRVKEAFFSKGRLADRHNDLTQRPNIYLAYHLYPSLLSKPNWIRAFKNNLKECWLAWGGLSTISKQHSLYHDTSTGETNQSYHRGDSWYFVNNYAALALNNLSHTLFKQYIDAITNASLRDLKEQGFLSHCSETSSAKVQRASGCYAQAWSASTLVSLLHALGKR